MGPYRDLADDLSALLFDRDPIGINFESNTDEYDPEAETIVLRLAAANFEPRGPELQALIHDEFVAWFGEIAGPHSQYHDLATDVGNLVAAWTTDRDDSCS